MDGPTAVRVGLLKGLDRIRQPYRLNPPAWQVTPYVGVLSNIEALRWATAAKRSGRIQRLVAGPNLVVTPDEHDGILTAPEIDCIMTPSAWVSRLYESTCPSLARRTVEWAVGVDQSFWCPSGQGGNGDRCDFLIYQKIQQPHNMPVMESVIEELRRRNLSYHVLAYGRYTPSEYRSLLHKSRAMIFLSESESQGIALFEAWACDVPTLVWDRGYWHQLNGPHSWSGASSAPYLRAACGLKFATVAEFPSRLSEFWARLDSFHPREHILQNYTLAHGARNYLKAFEL
ncbi:MAG: glycosyltransferase [Chloroflexi bacterium]|nr:glycosyltransferase [Chloroflexota bacterium]